MQAKLSTPKNRTCKDLHKKVLQLDLAKFDTKGKKTLSRLIRKRQLQLLRQPNGQNPAYSVGVDL